MLEFIENYPYLLPFFIFFGRIIDVTLGTLRIIFVSKGERYIAPVIGFFEVFIWIVIISGILTRANDLVSYLSYAAGYAMGNFVGIIIEQKIAFGTMLIRVYTKEIGHDLVLLLNKKGYGATLLHGSGSVGQIDVVETVVDRKHMKEVVNTLEKFDPDVFYVSEDIRTKRRGIFIKNNSLLNRWRIGK